MDESVRPLENWLRIAGVLALATLLCTIQGKPFGLISSVHEAEEARTSGLYDQSADLFRRAYLYTPWDHQYLSEIAESELSAGDFQSVQIALEDLQTYQELTAEEYIWLGLAYAGQGDPRTAAEQWEQARHLGTFDKATLVELLDFYESNQEWVSAISVLESLIAIEPDAHEYWYRYGLYLALEEPGRAEPPLGQALRLHRGYVDKMRAFQLYFSARADLSEEAAYVQLGTAYLQAGEVVLAEEAYRRAIAINPGYGEALAYLGYVLSLQDKSGSLTAIQQATDLASDNLTVLYLAGLTWSVNGNPSTARVFFQTAYDRDPVNPAFPVEIAGTYRQEGNLESAEVWLEEAIRLAPGDRRFEIILAQFYVDENFRVEDRGFPLAFDLATRYPDSAETRDALGWAYFHVGEFESAEKELIAALNLNPNLPRTLVHMGALMEQKGQTNDAILYYQSAIAVDPFGQWGITADHALTRLLGG